MIKRIFKAIFLFLMTLLMAVVMLALAVVVWPRLLINETVLSIAAHFAANRGIYLQWKDLHTGVDSISFLKKRVRLRVDGLCVNLQEANVSGCSKRIDLSAAAKFSSWPPQLFELGPLEIQKLKWQAGQGKSKISGSLDLSGARSPGQELDPARRWDFEALAAVVLPDRSKANVRADFQVKENPEAPIEIGFGIDGLFQQRQARIRARIDGDAKPSLLRGKITARASKFIDALPSIALNQCEFEVSEKNATQVKTTGRIQFKCPVRVKVPIPPEFQESDIGGVLQIPATAGATIHAHLNTSDFPPSSTSKVEGPISIDLDPVLHPLFRGDGNLKSEIAGVIGDFPNRWKMDSRFELGLRVARFESLVSHLRDTQWAVPAPFQVLKGKGSLQVEGEADLQRANIPIRFKTRLGSTHQSLKLDGQGELNIAELMKNPAARARFDLALSDVRLVLPRLDWGTPPPLIPDERIKVPEKLTKPKSTAEPFRYQVRVFTRPSKPIQLISNLASAPVPIHLDLQVSDSEPPKGNIRIASFPVEVFRRKADLDHFVLSLASPTSGSEIDGLLRIKYVDYQVQIKLLSTVDKPRVILTSDPPLPENQLMAILIFGRPLEELDMDETRSVGDVGAAAADGALSLASLYALASTPVQSVGYDPATGVVSAKVRLAEGTSLNLGTDSRSTSRVGVRKRLGKNWAIQTDVTNTAETGRIASAMLEWSHRY